MDVEWDEAKRLATITERGVDFQDAALIFLRPVVEAADDRFTYGETRMRALGRYTDDWFVVA